MSNWRKRRYGWTKETWLAYRAWAESFVRFWHNQAVVNMAIAEMNDRTD